MDNNARLMFLLNYMQSSILKKFLRDTCATEEFRTAVYYLPYLQPEEGSMFTHVLDVGYIVREIWELKENSLNYDYLITGALLHEYVHADKSVLEGVIELLRTNQVPEIGQRCIKDVILSPLEKEESILTTVTAESVIIRHAKKLANIIPMCDIAKDVRPGQKFYPLYKEVPILLRPIDIK